MGLLLVFNGNAFEAPPRVLLTPIGLALCPVRGIVFAEACVVTAWLLRIVATVHGLGLRCGFEVRPLALIVSKIDRLRTYHLAMSKT